jgi:hypothetical protein
MHIHEVKGPEDIYDMYRTVMKEEGV